MLVPTDPLVIIATAIVLWLFWIACVLRDHRKAAEVGPRRDTMPSDPGAVVRSLDALSASDRSPGDRANPRVSSTPGGDS